MNWATFDVCMVSYLACRVWGFWLTQTLLQGPFKMNAIRFMNQQPIRLQASNIHTGEVYFAVEFDHKRLHPDLYPPEEHK